MFILRNRRGFDDINPDENVVIQQHIQRPKRIERNSDSPSAADFTSGINIKVVD